jgi:sugar phosphate isomerase/epimerase
LISGDLSGLEPAAAAIIERAAATRGVIALARRMKIDPVVLLIGLLARSQEAINRTAARVAKAILGKRQVSEVEQISAQLGLEATSPTPRKIKKPTREKLIKSFLDEES